MSTLTKIEKLQLEKFLRMGDGYVLGFSDKTFEEFILETIGVDISEEQYKANGTSKAKRLRTLWEIEDDYKVGKLIAALVKYQQTKLDDLEKPWPTGSESNDGSEECLGIAQRLMNNGDPDEEVSVSASFENIQSDIISQIQSAQFIIWIAMAWFTDSVIFENLKYKHNQGVNIQLIINDDNINNESKLDYNIFQTYRIPRSGNHNNLMHHKFCIIDLKTVIHGSYNWTNKARFNKENITIVSNRKTAEEFAHEFLKLKRLCR